MKRLLILLPFLFGLLYAIPSFAACGHLAIYNQTDLDINTSKLCDASEHIYDAFGIQTIVLVHNAEVANKDAWFGQQIVLYIQWLLSASRALRNYLRVELQVVIEAHGVLGHTCVVD